MEPYPQDSYLIWEYLTGEHNVVEFILILPTLHECVVEARKPVKRFGTNPYPLTFSGQCKRIHLRVQEPILLYWSVPNFHLLSSSPQHAPNSDPGHLSFWLLTPNSHSHRHKHTQTKTIMYFVCSCVQTNTLHFNPLNKTTNSLQKPQQRISLQNVIFVFLQQADGPVCITFSLYGGNPVIWQTPQSKSS